MNKELSVEVIKEFEEIALKFEGQYNKFIRDTDGESHFQIILRAHLYIEHELLAILEQHLKYPHIILDKIRFIDIVNLVFALGLLPIEDIKVFQKINRLRNLFAHDLEFTLNDEDISQLLNLFNPSLQKSFHSFLKSKKNVNTTTRLQTALFTIWSYVIGQNIIPSHIKDMIDEINQQGSTT